MKPIKYQKCVKHGAQQITVVPDDPNMLADIVDNPYSMQYGFLVYNNYIYPMDQNMEFPGGVPIVVYKESEIYNDFESWVINF
jgi:hypothetical protein